MKTNTHLTLEHLENEFWGNPEHDSHLVRTCHSLRQKPLKEFSIENLRIMIGQSIGLKYLVPLAIEELKKNVMTEGDFFEGDLLQNVLSIKTKDYWKNHNKSWFLLLELIERNRNKFSDKFYQKISERIDEIKK